MYQSEATRTSRQKTVVVIHAFYEKEFELILAQLRELEILFDLYITTSNLEIYNRCKILELNHGGIITAYLVENIGRDIAPFLSCFLDPNMAAYQNGLKLHTKRSPYSEKGEVWAQTLIQGLLNPLGTTDGVIQALSGPEIGLCGISGQHLTAFKYWGENRFEVNRIFNSIVGKKRASLRPNFFAGSMFWFKPAALSLFVSQLLSDNNYFFEPELGQRDGTLAHVIERMFCDAVESQGHIVSSTIAPSKPIDKSKSRRNRIIIDSGQPLGTSFWLLGEIYRTLYKFLSSRLRKLA